VRYRTDRTIAIVLRWEVGKRRDEEEMDTNLQIVLTMLLALCGGGVYWGMGLGWGIGPVGLIITALVFAYLLYGEGSNRGR